MARALICAFIHPARRPSGAGRHGTEFLFSVWISLGDFPDLGLKETRDLAGWVRTQSSRGWSAERIRTGIRSEHHAGVNPGSTNPERTTVTFREVAKVWFERKRTGRKNSRHIDQNWNAMVACAFPRIGRRPVGEISRLEVVEALRPIWHSKSETARRRSGGAARPSKAPSSSTMSGSVLPISIPRWRLQAGDPSPPAPGPLLDPQPPYPVTGFFPVLEASRQQPVRFPPHGRFAQIGSGTRAT